MTRQRRPTVGAVRAAAVLGCVGLAVAGLNVLLMPAAIVGLLAGIAGIRRTGDDLDAAGLRLGVALLVSVLVAVLTPMSGNRMLGTTGIATVVMFAVAWRTCQQLDRQRRRARGVRQRDILDRQARLHGRRAALRDRPGGGRDATAQPDRGDPSTSRHEG